MGWNTIYDLKTPLLEEISATGLYILSTVIMPLPDPIPLPVRYTMPFSAALHRDNFYATQFIPRKAGNRV